VTPKPETMAAKLPYEVLCWTPASADMVTRYKGAPYATLDPAPHRSHHHKRATAIAQCKAEARKLGLASRGEVYTVQAGSGTRCVEFSCRMAPGTRGQPRLIIEDLS
jgi:hypothetical protein